MIAEIPLVAVHADVTAVSVRLDDEPVDEMLMLACAMMQRSREIFDDILGVKGRKQMFKGVSE